MPGTHFLNEKTFDYLLYSCKGLKTSNLANSGYLTRGIIRETKASAAFYSEQEVCHPVRIGKLC